MRKWLLLAILGAGLGLVSLVPLSSAPPVSSERIEKLIADLGSSRNEDREKATRELAAIGKPALELLRKAARSGDLETQRRAGELIQRLEVRQTNEKALTPAKVHWIFKDKPVLEAIAEIKKQTGYPVFVYPNDEASLKGRTVTLDTGSVDFWTAFDRFCQAASVQEIIGQTPILPINAGVVIQQPAARQLPANTIQPAMGAYRQIHLVDGKPPGLPTEYHGAVRIRALPPETELTNNPPRVGREVRVHLDLAPEPRVELMRVLEVRVEKAVDERGQALTSLRDAAVNANVRVNLAAVAGATGQRALGRQMPVRLEAAAQPSRTLKELKGTILTTVRTAPQVMATVENILKANGKMVKGEQGITLFVREVKPLPGGACELQLTLERPLEVTPYIPPATAGGVMLPVQGGAGAGGGIQIQPIQIKPAALPIRQIQVQPIPIQPAVPPQAPAPGQKPAPGQPQVRPVPPAPGQPQVQPVPPAPGQPQVLPAVQPGVAGRAQVMAYLGLSVRDGQDAVIPLSEMRIKSQVNKGVYSYELTFTARPGPGQGEPTTLLFTGTRLNTIEIPFALKDVPLP